MGDISETPHARYVLIRVPRENWGQLEGPLQVLGTLPGHDSTTETWSSNEPSKPSRSVGVMFGLSSDEAEPDRKSAEWCGEHQEETPDACEWWVATQPDQRERRQAMLERSQEIRQRCYQEAKQQFRDVKIEEPEEPETSTNAAGFGEGYASMKAQDAARRKSGVDATPKEKALQWYRSCVVRKSKGDVRPP